ncbi:hypothetical protein HHK36_021158 [Tetracentron sinense]|uniref:Myb/SANT-like domain-containing protein n=1 Tax=Tetracentron sinense TaxID=13715 RepID=A0A834YUJ2_TETSI|nr:hypothetical protein HHK36_021158 [Tetracentron sinense]
MSQKEKKKVDTSRAAWPDNMRKILLDLCIEQVQLSGKPGVNFLPFTWKIIIDKYKEKTGRQYSQKQLRNQLDAMKRLYNAWVVLCGQTGIGRNDATHTITMDPERWEAYLETHKDAKPFMTKPLPFPEEMALLFDGISATGAAKWAPTVGSVPEDLLGNTHSSYDLSDNIEIPSSNVTQSHNETQQKTGEEVDDVEFMENIRRKQPKPPKSKRDSEKATLDASIASLVSSIKEDTSKGPSIAECIESLQQMQDVVEPSPLFLCALRSFRNLENRSIWMMLKKEESRLEWLMDLLDRELDADDFGRDNSEPIDMDTDLGANMEMDEVRNAIADAVYLNA